MDYRLDERQSQRIEFTWHGFDEGDELAGRGHAEIVKDELHGHHAPRSALMHRLVVACLWS